MEKEEIKESNVYTGGVLVRTAMIGLCVAVIVLQGADAISTYLALATGKASEQNGLLVVLSDALGWPIMRIVLVAKITVACVFSVAILKTKPTWRVVWVLVAVAAYYTAIVAANFHWAKVLW